MEIWKLRKATIKRLYYHKRNQPSKNQTSDISFLTFAAMKILMVCLGNICRSPLAEGILQNKAWKAGLQWSVESAGTNGYHIGEAPHRLSQKVAQQHGIDISQQRARKFTAVDFENFDIIYAMAEEVKDEMKWIAKNKYNEHKVDLLMNELYPGKNIDVPDPWYGPEPGYHEVYKMIDEACEKIIEKNTIKN
jgi:protein-tyrosine phosphatase